MNQDNTSSEATKTLIDEELNGSRNRKKDTTLRPYIARLKEIDWFIFGFVNWRRGSRRSFSNHAQKQRTKDFNLLINVFCEDLELDSNCLGIYRTTAYDLACEPHHLFLISKMGLEHLPVVECVATLEGLWRDYLIPHDYFDLGIGNAVIEPYEEAKEWPAAKRLLKRGIDDAGEKWEKDDYFSPYLMKVIQSCH